MKFALRWSLEVCHIYTSLLDVPALVSRIHYFNHTAKLTCTIPTRQSLEDNVIKYSSDYLHQKERGKLSKMSRLHDQWRRDDEIDSQERMHYLYLMHLHVYIEASGEQCDDWDFQKVLARRFEFLLQHQCYLILNRRPGDHRDKVILGDVSIEMVSRLLWSVLLTSEIEDKMFLIQIEILNREFRRAAQRIQDKDDRIFYTRRAYLLMGFYHFWHKFNYKKGVKYMNLGINMECRTVIHTERQTLMMKYLYEMESAVVNMPECLRLIDLLCQRKDFAIDKIHLLQQHRIYVREMLRRRPGFELDTRSHKKAIQSFRRESLSFDTSNKGLSIRIMELLRNDVSFTIAVNVLREKECFIVDEKISKGSRCVHVVAVHYTVRDAIRKCIGMDDTEMNVTYRSIKILCIFAAKA